MRTEAHYLWDIIDAVDAIDRFIAGKNIDQFAGDEILRSAVHAKLIIAGEAVTQLSDSLTGKYPLVPWQQIRGFRNVVIHGYFKIDWDIIWGAATKDAPELREAETLMLSREFPDFRPENS